MKQGLATVENACYTVKVPGSTIPKPTQAELFPVNKEMIYGEQGISNTLTGLFS